MHGSQGSFKPLQCVSQYSPKQRWEHCQNWHQQGTWAVPYTYHPKVPVVLTSIFFVLGLDSEEIEMGLWTVEKGPLTIVPHKPVVHDCEQWTRSQCLHTKGSLASYFYPLPARKIISASKNHLSQHRALILLLIKPHLQGLMSKVSILKSLLHVCRSCFLLQLCLGIQGFLLTCSQGPFVGWPSLPKHSHWKHT